MLAAMAMPLCIPCEAPQANMDIEYSGPGEDEFVNQCRTLFRVNTCYNHANLPIQIQNAGCIGDVTAVWVNVVPLGNGQWQHIGEITLDTNVTLPCEFEVRFADGVARDEDQWNESLGCCTEWYPVTIDCRKPENLRASRSESGDITFEVDSCVSVRWEIVNNHGNCSKIVDQQFTGGRLCSGRLESCECLGYPSEERKVTVRAYDGRTVAGTPNDCYAEITVSLDYDCGRKDGIADLGSVLFGIDLGKNSRGIDVGDIEIRETQPTAALESPLTMKYPVTTPDVQVVRDPIGGYIKQLRSPEVFLNVVNDGSIPRGYKIELYSFDNATPVGDPPTSFSIGGVPHTVWTIQNVGTSGTYNRFDFTQFVDPELSGTLSPRKQDSYHHLDGHDWRLQTYDVHETVQLMQTREVLWSGATEQRITKDATGAETARVHRTTSTLPDGRKAIEIAVDPSGANQITRVTYYVPVGDTPERVQSIEEPSGAWRYFEYEDSGDNSGFVATVYRPWLDGIPLSSFDPENPLSAGVQVSTYFYGETGVLRHLPTREESRAPNENGDLQTIHRLERTVVPLGSDIDGNGANDVQIQEKYFTLYDGSSASTFLETLTTLRSFNDLRPTSIQRPDGTVGSFSYQKGTVTFNSTNPNSSSFVASPSGLHERVLVTEGDTGAPGGRAGKPSQWALYTGRTGEALLERTFVATQNNANPSGSYAQIGWVGIVYDPRVRPIKTLRSDNTISERTWDNCCLTSEEVDELGVRRTTVHDVLGRVERSTLEGAEETEEYDAQATIQTDVTYSKSGLLNRIASSASPLSTSPVFPSITVAREYDLAGRLCRSFDAADRGTEVTYPDASTVRTDFPNGGEEEREFFVDGRIKRISGSAAIERNYEYGVSSATGYPWTRVRIGAPDGLGNPSLRTVTTQFDLLGRTVSEERPGFGGTDTLSVVSEYDATTGQLEKRFVELNNSGAPFQAPTLYEYDVSGRLARVGVDVDGNNVLDAASLDRITVLPNPLITQIGGGSDWWVQSLTQAYQTDNSATLTTLATQRRQLTGLTGGGAEVTVARFESLDYYSNVSATTVKVDRGAKLSTETTTVAGSTYPTSSTNRNGLLQKTIGRDLLTTYFGYDGFHRRNRVKDSRDLEWTLNFDESGQLVTSTAPGGNTSTFSWSDTSGELLWVKNADDKYTRYAHNALGQPTQVWGDVPQPMQLEYDRFGQLEKLHTYRSGSHWSDSAWPAQYTGDDDVTTWEFDEATGLLTKKLYDDGSAVDLDYYPEGRVHTRTWAREVTTGQRVAATYSHSRASAAATGDLLSVTYNDGTPQVAYGFDRRGRLREVRDGKDFGLRTLNYAASGLLLTEVFGSGSPFNGKQLRTQYQDQVVYPGNLPNVFRITSFLRLSTISFGTSSNPVQDYAAAYDYDRDTDRMTKITGPGLPTGGANYTYLQDSSLLEFTNFKSGTTTIASTKREYENGRNLLSGVLNHWHPGAGFDISHYSYRSDVLSRRSDVLYAGQAFQLSGSNGSAGGHFDLWEYNERNEIKQVERFLGTDPDSPQLSNAQPTLGREYLYDSIGNRAKVTEGIQPGLFYCTNGVNAYTATDTASGCQMPVTETFQHDADGNLKQDGTLKYEWDAENRLKLVEPVSPTTGSQQLTFSYDYLGRRTDKKVFDWTGTAFATTPSAHKRWVYFGWMVLVEFDVTGSGPTISRKFTWGLDVSQTVGGAAGVGGLLATLDTSGNRTFLHFYDGNGNTGQLVETTTGTNYGSVVARYEYDAFGKSLLDPSNSTVSGTYAATNTFRFSTKQFDAETGLGYWGKRYYDSRNGRWTSRDPLQESDGANIVAYVRNHPSGGVDPHGLGIFLPGGPIGNSGIGPRAGFSLDGPSRSEALERFVIPELEQQARLRNRIDQTINRVNEETRDCLCAVGMIADAWLPTANRFEPKSAVNQVRDALNPFREEANLALGQGGLNAVQATQNVAVSLLNSVKNATLGVQQLPDLPSHQWAKDAALPTSQGVFDASVGLSEFGIETLAGAMIGNVGRATAAEEILFGQRRISPRFSNGCYKGRLVVDVADDLRMGRISPDTLPLEVFEYNRQLVSGNSRSLAALRDAGVRPTCVTRVPMRDEWFERLMEDPIIDSPLPGPRVPITPRNGDDTILDVLPRWMNGN